MKRQKDDEATITRQFAYGSVPARVVPVGNEELALVQLRLARRLWNVLVAIEHVRVERYRLIMRDPDQERVDAIKEELKQLREAIRAARKGGVADLGEMPTRILALKQQLASFLERLKSSSAERHGMRKTDLEANTALATRRVKRARQAAASMGLFWGSYNAVVQSADAGRKLGNLKFRGFRGEGTLTTQVMGGATVSACVSNDRGGSEHTFFNIGQPVAGRKWRWCHLRIGSNADRSPVWLQIPIVYHRDIPPAALIKSVSATRRIVAGKVRWQITVTCTLPAPKMKTGDKAIAIDIGWRLMDNGVRVGYWADTAGGRGDVRVNESDIQEFRRVYSLRGICDNSRNQTLPMLAAWLESRYPGPEWRMRAANLSQWRSSDRLAGLIRWWADNRLENDTELFEAAAAWRKQYLHLANWWRNLSEQMTLRIREQYRVFAAGIARKYDVLVIEAFDLREVAEKPPPESTEIRTESAAYRQMVSPSVLRTALVDACSREGLHIVRLPAAYTTRCCHICGDDAPWDTAVNVMHRCANGHFWDQDFNACRNLLSQYASVEPILEPSG